MTPYQTYISKSRYSRFLDDKGRREHWHETVARYFNFMEKHLHKQHGYSLNSELRSELENAVLNLEVMPSMRSIMTAGEALERQNIAGYNCSYLPIDDMKSFDEAMYILLCGTGVGFSVEQKYVNKLPEIPEKLFDSNTVVVVKDSKEGWAKALRQVIALLYAGEVPKWDVSAVRAAGTRLKTFGGRASGPEPLVDLFKYVTAKFKAAAGRKLTSLEAHDILCKIGEVVVVGGVRRSAMISLSDLTDDRMAHAKAGNWWEGNGQRALSNNSAVYDSKPSVGQFMREWSSIYESHSGERGIFNRYASEAQAAKSERRELGKEWGTNPCCFTGDMRLLTAEGYVDFATLSKQESVNVVNHNGQVTEGKVWSSGVKPIVEVRFSGERSSITCTDDHRFMLTDGTECMAKALKGKRLKAFFQTNKAINTESVIAGYAFGDGAVHRLGSDTHRGVEVYFGKKDKDVAALVGQDVGIWYSRQAADWLKNHNVEPSSLLNKRLPLHASDDFVMGLFSANGCVVKGHRVAFKSISKGLIEDLKYELSLYGIHSYITVNKARKQKFSNGEYEMKTSYDLNISQFDSIVRFAEQINFVQEYKREALAELIDLRSPYVSSVKAVGEQEVFDFTEPDTHWGVVEGVVVHNSEIILRPYQFCNLSSVIVRSDDTEETLKRKVRLATILGTFQSTMTHFPYLRKVWQTNTEEERLLGVSMTGILDNVLLNNPDNADLPRLLEELKYVAVATNSLLALELGINASAAITCVKPEGTVSQLTDTASGIHPQHSSFYIRRVRSDNKDPLTSFLKQSGFPSEPCVMKPDSTTVFAFPMKVAAGAVLREDLSAIQHLRLWLMFQRYWCEHKPSVTISVREDEWPTVGAWVWDHFDEITGVSFLPMDGGTYRQAPYTECTKEEYEEAVKAMPLSIEWDSFIEVTDNVEGVQTLACVAGVCSI